MELEKFGEFIKGKSFDETLHSARRKSLERILASEDDFSFATKPETEDEICNVKKPSAKPIIEGIAK